MRARSDAAADGSTLLGERLDAADGPDRWDQRKPPVAPTAWVRLGIANPDWPARPGLYRRDVRAPAEGHAWELELRSEIAGETVTLEMSPESRLPEGLCFRLIDREQESAIGLVGGIGSYRVLSPGPDRGYRFTLLAGSAEFVARGAGQRAQVPARLTFDPGAPNPTRGANRFRFGLPRPEPARLEVFDVTGERVASVIEDRLMPAGYHAVVWDGRARGGRPLPSGVYFCRLVMGRESITRRLVMIR